MSTYKNWTEYKEALLEGMSDKEAAVASVLMENTHRENLNVTDGGANRTLVEAEGPVGSTGTGNITRYDTLFMPLIRRTQPALLATQLVGVQPLTMPTGIVRTIRHRYGETTETSSGSGTNAVEAGTEASGQNVYEKYSALALGDAYDAVDAMNPFEQTQHMEWAAGKPLNLEVVTDRVDTKTRKLSSSWSLESQDDLAALDGLDIESEISNALGDEIQREMDREILGELNALAGTIESFDFANVDGRYAGEKLAGLTIAMDNLSAQIAMKTKRRGATWLVVSQKVFTALKNASNSTFVPANSGELSISSTAFVGTFGGNIQVYVDSYAETDSILMGLKASDIDTGMFYCPYQMLSSSGVVRDSATANLHLHLRTRYGLHSFTNDETSLGDSSDYYARASVANLQLGFK